MASSIPERDWKVFRELHRVALDRLCEKILAEAKDEIERPGKRPHEKYLSLFNLIKDRDEDISRGFDDFRRSTAWLQIALIHRMGLFTDDEVRRFSPETIEMLEKITAIRGD